MSAGASKHHQIQQGVGSQTVGTVDTGTGGLATGKQPWHHLITLLGCVGDDLWENRTVNNYIIKWFTVIKLGETQLRLDTEHSLYLSTYFRVIQQDF